MKQKIELIKEILKETQYMPLIVLVNVVVTSIIISACVLLY